MRKKHLTELDGIRALAALLVMFFHFSGQINRTDVVSSTIKHFASFGQTGVTLFFVLSGFLITRILFKGKNHQNYFSNFYIRRSLRIFPLYYAALLIYLFIYPTLRHLSYSFASTWYCLVYLQNFAFTFNWPIEAPNHLWSLAVEEHFYLFWPLFIYYLDEKWIGKVCALLIVSSIACRMFLMYNGYGPGFYFTFTNLDGLAIGALIAIVELNRKEKHYLFYLTCFLLLFIPTAIIGTFVSGKHMEWVQYIKPTAMAFSYYYLILYILVISHSHFIKEIFSSKPLTYTGKISYGLYVYHPLCYALLDAKLSQFHWLVSLFIEIGVTYFVASVSFYSFEIWFLKLKEKYPERKQTRSASKALVLVSKAGSKV